MTTTQTGHRAEAVVAERLKLSGYQLIAQNWRCRYCEIDLIAAKSARLYFVEVKYRKTTNQGTGLDYITPQKLKRMRFAAHLWVSQHPWKGDFSLVAAQVGGPNFIINRLVCLDEL